MDKQRYASDQIITLNMKQTFDYLENVAFATKQTMVATDFVGIVSAKNDADNMAKAGWKCEKILVNF